MCFNNALLWASFKMYHQFFMLFRQNNDWAQQTQNMCITFVQRRPNVSDAGRTLYKCYTNVLCLLGCRRFWQLSSLKCWRAVPIFVILIVRTSAQAHDVVATPNKRCHIGVCSTDVQSQKAVSAYFTSKQILPCGFAEQSRPYPFSKSWSWLIFQVYGSCRLRVVAM